MCQSSSEKFELMKTSYTILILVVFQLLVLHTSAQTFISQKQEIYTFKTQKTISVIGERKIVIEGNNFDMDLPNGEKLKGTLKFISDQVKRNGFVEKIYSTNAGVSIYLDFNKVLVITDEKPWIAYSFLLANYIKPTEEELILDQQWDDQQIEKRRFKNDVKYYGEFTAKCIQDKKVRPMMKELAITEILGEPISVNKTVTINMIRRQYVYKDTYIYTENGIVTTIQTKE